MKLESNNDVVIIIILFVFNLQLCEHVSPVVTFVEVKQFFVEKWAPEIVQLHTLGEGALDSFLAEICDAIQGLERFEVNV